MIGRDAGGGGDACFKGNMQSFFYGGRDIISRLEMPDDIVSMVTSSVICDVRVRVMKLVTACLCISVLQSEVPYHTVTFRDNTDSFATLPTISLDGDLYLQLMIKVCRLVMGHAK